MRNVIVLRGDEAEGAPFIFPKRVSFVKVCGMFILWLC